MSGVVLGLTVSSLAMFAWFAVRYYVGEKLRTMDFSEAAVKAEKVGKQIEWVRRIAASGSFPSRRINHTSIGDPILENKLIALSRESGIYESVHHRLPNNFEELERLRLPQNWEETLEKLEKECQIVSLTPNSAILNCDNWTRPSEDELNTLIRSFEPHTERFYQIDRHILLYIPPFTKG